MATFFLVAGVHPLFEGIAWNGRFGVKEAIKGVFGEAFHDFAGSVVVHAVGGWVGLVAVNSLMAMVGGTLGAVALGRNDPGFAYNGPLAGRVAVCAGSDVMHPVGALAVELVAGVLFVRLFTLCQNRWKIDAVLGVWPLHGLCGAWGDIACGIFGQRALGGLGGVSLGAQVAGTALGIVVALTGAAIVYGLLRRVVALRLSDEQEFDGADIAIHRISATPERELQS